MATTLATATVEAREVLRCERCSLVQFRTADSLCRRCHKPLEREEPEPAIPALTPQNTSAAEAPPIDVARAVREMRRARSLSQRQLAGRMQVPRTYISKIENGKAMPTLASLERLASALDASVSALVHDPRSRRQDAIVALAGDPFIMEILPYANKMNAYQRSVFLNAVREAAGGRRRVLA